MTDFEWVAVAVVTVMSAARLTRLATYDSFPPTAWLRDKYADATDGTKWQILAYCPYCASFWLTLLVVGSGWLSDWHTAWWLFNATMGASYLAAIAMVLDQDEDDD